jgi:AhpD family alkylhydroperoxidase
LPDVTADRDGPADRISVSHPGQAFRHRKKGDVTMQARMKNPAMIVPGAMQAILTLWASVEKAGLPPGLLDLVHLRISQINGCAFCLVSGTAKARKEGASDERIAAIAGWRDAPYFTDAERAALALAEAVTRLSDRPDPVPDDIWNEARKHYDEGPIATLLVAIATINVFNRLNVPVRQLPGDWK